MIGQGYFLNEWAFVFFALACLVTISEVYFRRKFKFSLLLRFLWVALIGLVIAEWTMITSSEWSQPELLHVFIDGSDSVVKIENRKSNLETIVKDFEIWSEEKNQPIRFYTFGRSLKNGVELSGGFQTFLKPALKAIESSEGKAVVISDGLWKDYARFKIPTYAVQISDEKERDVWFEDIQPLFTAFLKHRLKIPVILGNQGYSGKTVKVSLLLKNEVIEEKAVRLEREETKLEFSYFPEKMGESIFQIRIEPLEGELAEINNIISFRVRTVRDKIRVLHIGGKPSYDLKSLRAFLTRQPDVDLVSFYILRSLLDHPEARNDELSLIPFPYEELFSTELEKFDVVILHNFDFNLYFQPFYLENLARFIRSGGALMIIGGDQSFDRYRYSPLAPIFPFKYVGDAGLSLDMEFARVVSDHPVIKDLTFAFQLQKWSARHKVASHQDAVDLVRYESGRPLLSLRQFQKGRVVSVNTDELWMLQMKPSKESTAYARLIRRVLQYLTFDPEVEPRQIKSDEWKSGQEVSVRLAGEEVSDWRVVPLSEPQSAETFRQFSEIKYKIPEPGVYEVENSLLDESTMFETLEKPWNGEWRKVVHDNLKLKQVAKESGAKFFKFDERKNIFSEPLSGRQMISAKTKPWNQSSAFMAWAILILTLMIMSLDFFLRKRDQWDV